MPVSIAESMLGSGALWIAGDGLAQLVENWHAGPAASLNFDLSRTCRFIVLAVYVMSPLAFHWYLFLEDGFPGQDFAAVVQRVVLDQIIWAPCALSLFLFALGVLESNGAAGGLFKVRDNLRRVLYLNWLVWPIVQALDFAFVSPSYRVLFVNAVSIPWSGLLAHVVSARRAERERRLSDGEDEGSEDGGQRQPLVSKS